MIEKFLKMFFPTFVTHKRNIESAKVFERARDDKGRLKADDKKTPTFNVAWVGGLTSPTIFQPAPRSEDPDSSCRVYVTMRLPPICCQIRQHRP